MAKVSIIDPSELSLNIMGISVSGFSVGTFVTITRSEPLYFHKRSLKGKVQVRRNVSGYYTLKFTLDNTSSSNTWIHVICKLQQQYGVVFPLPVIFTDNMGDSKFFCKTAVIEEPETSHGTTLGQTEWELVCHDVQNVIGGNQQDSMLSEILSSISMAISLAGVIGLDLQGLLNEALFYSQKGVNSAIDNASDLFQSISNGINEI